jgi:hypothetical protein
MHQCHPSRDTSGTFLESAISSWRPTTQSFAADSRRFPISFSRMASSALRRHILDVLHYACVQPQLLPRSAKAGCRHVHERVPRQCIKELERSALIKITRQGQSKTNLYKNQVCGAKRTQAPEAQSAASVILIIYELKPGIQLPEAVKNITNKKC